MRAGLRTMNWHQEFGTIWVVEAAADLIVMDANTGQVLQTLTTAVVP